MTRSHNYNKKARSGRDDRLRIGMCNSPEVCYMGMFTRCVFPVMENFYKDELVFSESARSMEGGWVGFRAVHPPSSGVCTSAGRVDGPAGSRNFL